MAEKIERLEKLKQRTYLLQQEQGTTLNSHLVDQNSFDFTEDMKKASNQRNFGGVEELHFKTQVAGN